MGKKILSESALERMEKEYAEWFEEYEKALKKNARAAHPVLYDFRPGG